MDRADQRRAANCWKQLAEGPSAGKWYDAYVPQGSVDRLVKQGKVRHIDDRPEDGEIVARNIYAHADAEADPQKPEPEPTPNPEPVADTRAGRK